MITFLKQLFNIALFGIIFLIVFGERSFSATCCAGGGGQSICVLPAEQRYQLGLTNSYRTIQGEFDPYGEYSSYSDGTAYFG